MARTFRKSATGNGRVCTELQSPCEGVRKYSPVAEETISTFIRSGFSQVAVQNVLVLRALSRNLNLEKIAGKSHLSSKWNRFSKTAAKPVKRSRRVSHIP